jgi:peptidylprolyl isomerase
MRSLLFILFSLLLGSGAVFGQTDTVSTASGLKYIYLKNGSGTAIKTGSKATVHYTGWLLNGTQFDSSEGKKPIKINAGTGQVIKGWDELLLLLRTGDEVEVIIPANLAYAQRGVPNAEGNYLIPPDSPLKFRLKIVEVKP